MNTKKRGRSKKETTEDYGDSDDEDESIVEEEIVSTTKEEEDYAVSTDEYEDDKATADEEEDDKATADKDEDDTAVSDYEEEEVKKKPAAKVSKPPKEKKPRFSPTDSSNSKKKITHKTTKRQARSNVAKESRPVTRAQQLTHSSESHGPSLSETSEEQLSSLHSTFVNSMDNNTRLQKGSTAYDGQSLEHSSQADTNSNDVNADSLSTNTSLNHFRAYTCTSPFHLDLAARRAYYKQLEIRPPYNNYAIPPPKDYSSQRWTVKMGDVVVLHWDTRAGKTYFDIAGNGIHTKQSKKFPFNVPWSVGEVVTIWRTFASVKETKDAARTNHFQDDVKSLQVEIRWFYRQAELSAVASASNDFSTVLEEVFETDQMDDCSADCILAPAILVDHDNPSRPSQIQLGMPVVELFCRRFWSVHRGSLVPCGGLSGRISRARIHSKYLEKDASLRSAFERSEAITSSSASAASQTLSSDSSGVWRKAFAKVIKKLTLTDASEASQRQGSGLIGRESEQKQILNFLRDAVRGTAKSPSLFVGGSPGVGKTASVRYAIQKLQHEQAAGKIPHFQFISINGMEMMDPFESYVKLCESLSQFGKNKRTPEAAAALLETYFTREERSTDHKSNPEITVILLDEIDYLVTKKQTVLYNFFDWPLRAAACNHGRRLVVVGISNTLNLPDKLLPSVQSRIGTDRCIFKVYNQQQLTAILNAKIHEASPDYVTFEADAVTFAAKKTAVRSGDLRRALQLCRVAAENVVQQIDEGASILPIVRIGDIHRASRDCLSSMFTAPLSLLMPLEALVIVGVASLHKSSGRTTGGFDIQEVMTKIESIAAASGEMQYLPCPSFSEVLDIVQRLGEARLLGLFTPRSSGRSFRAAQGGSGGAWPVISLSMDYQDVRAAMKNSPYQTLVAKVLSDF